MERTNLIKKYRGKEKEEDKQAGQKVRKIRCKIGKEFRTKVSGNNVCFKERNKWQPMLTWGKNRKHYSHKNK